MSKVSTTIINLYGGPGTGKSTTACYFYYLLKIAGENAELVREYVKDWAWDQRQIKAFDQIYFMGKQSRHESMLYGKVNYIITDSPVLMNCYYAVNMCDKHLADGIKAATLGFYRQAEADGYRHIHVLLKRTTPYAQQGRYQNEETALKIDVEIENFLNSLDFPYVTCPIDDESLKNTLEKIKNKII